MSDKLIDRVVKAMMSSGIKVIDEPLTNAERQHRRNEHKSEVIAGHFNQVDGIKVSSTADYQCKGCKKRFGDPAIDAGHFLPELRVCEDCLVDLNLDD